jgi:predicted Holliday junction resolvase-like endonuclease
MNKYKQKIEDSLKEKLKDEVNIQANSVINYNMRELEKIVSQVPEKVLKSITSSSNVKKGALGELIGYVEIKATYDRIIPLGNIVDFIGIKFDKENEQGYIDFIDVKTGKSARLSKDQKALQQLVTEKRINFIKVKVESENQP